MATAIYYFDASDAAATDPDSHWQNDSDAFNDESLTTTADNSAAVLGSESTGFLKAEGTNAPTSGDPINRVSVAVYTQQANGPLWVRIYTDGLAETLATVTTFVTARWTPWTELTVPSGGWTWAKIAALEVKLWRNQAVGTSISVGLIRIMVDYGPANKPGNYGKFVSVGNGMARAERAN